MRLPLGSLFSVFGALLVLCGLLSDRDATGERSLGINIDRDWGLVLLLFGASMLALALRARRHDSGSPPQGGP